MWKDSNYLERKVRPFLAWCIQHGQHAPQQAASVEQLPDTETNRLTVTTEQLKRIQDTQGSPSRLKARVQHAPHKITEETYGAESYATIPMPIVLTDTKRPDPDTDRQVAAATHFMTFRWDSMWGYRDIAPMLYQARLDYYKKFGGYPRRMTVSRWNWTNAWLRDIRDYPLCMGRVGRDEVVCEG